MATKDIAEGSKKAEKQPKSKTTPEETINFMQQQGTTELLETATPRTGRPRPRVHGGVEQRGLMDVPHSPLFQGRFGRMFRNLPALFVPNVDDLNALADHMIAKPGDAAADNPDIPSGYTYLGQFIDHDITFDPTSRLQRDNDPNALVNFRTPRFDLDSIYGAGPADDPYLYQADGIRLRVGKTKDNEDDCPRTSLDRMDGAPSTPEDRAGRRALIGDPRNDENIIINQLHLSFIKYHNQVVSDLEAEGVSGEETLFNEARRIVRWHYQWIVVFDFLNRMVGEEVVADILKVGQYVVHRLNGGSPHEDGRVVKVDLKFFNWRNQPFIPVEFSGAAYRFGHSMVRQGYRLNSVTPFIPIFSKDFGNEFSDLRGNRERPSFWEIEWQKFLEFPEASEEPQPSLKIDAKLARGLAELPFAPLNLPSLAARNLQRGQALGLPSGQTLARAMGLPEELILKNRQLDLPYELVKKFGEHSPLWYYILKEAEVMAGGLKLGPVGGRIVAEVLIGLLGGDPQSFVSVAPGWTPTAYKYGAPASGRMTLPDLIRHAGMKIKDPERAQEA